MWKSGNPVYQISITKFRWLFFIGYSFHSINCRVTILKRSVVLSNIKFLVPRVKTLCISPYKDFYSTFSRSARNVLPKWKPTTKVFELLIFSYIFVLWIIRFYTDIVVFEISRRTTNLFTAPYFSRVCSVHVIKT